MHIVGAVHNGLYEETASPSFPQVVLLIFLSKKEAEHGGTNLYISTMRAETGG